MDTIKMKKELQKVVKQIRDDLNQGRYPKAMMTGQQIAKRTATINLGERRTDDFAGLYSINLMGMDIMADNRFKSFCEAFSVRVTKIESVSRDMYTTTQIRIIY